MDPIGFDELTEQIKDHLKGHLQANRGSSPSPK
jgi:hypothetical protein